MGRISSTMWVRICIGLILLFVIGCGSSSEAQNVKAVKEVALIANTPVPVVKEVKTIPTQVVIIPTKAPISASSAVTKTEVTPSPTPAAQPTMSSVSMTKSDETDSKQAAQSVFKECEATAVVEQKPKSDLPEKEQIAGLSEIASTYFSGTNNTGLPRLKIPPDVRKSRRGGIVVNIEFNGDEYPTLLEKKTGLDCIMRDGYEAVSYTHLTLPPIYSV